MAQVIGYPQGAATCLVHVSNSAINRDELDEVDTDIEHIGLNGQAMFELSFSRF